MAPRILILEDVPDWRTTLSAILEESEFSVTAVGTTAEARNILAKEQFDLALLDIRLDENEEDEGLDFAEEINKLWPTVKVIFVTGYANDSYIERAMVPRSPSGKRLAVDFVKKNDISNLVAIVQRTLA